MNNIIISNPKKLEKVKHEIARGDAEALHILADFDRTLTTAFVNGKSVPSLISILRDGNYLTPDYAEKAHELFNTYHSIEIDPSVPFEKKKIAMEEWWRKHSELLIKSGLENSDLEKIATSGKVKLREGFVEFANLLHAHNIPLVIMSASGVGSDVIPLYLENERCFYNNMHVVSNSYEWDAEGRAIAIRQPIIHALNKYETAIQNYPVFDIIAKKKNVILLGDSLDDVGMVEGFEYDHLIKIGFLNDKVEENLEHYKKAFDVVLTGDASMAYVNELLNEVTQ
jgi:HAD superfamily hydrolase (TIGR01544 family)